MLNIGECYDNTYSPTSCGDCNLYSINELADSGIPGHKQLTPTPSPFTAIGKFVLKKRSPTTNLERA
jgi:hypothetical protein